MLDILLRGGDERRHAEAEDDEKGDTRRCGITNQMRHCRRAVKYAWICLNTCGKGK